MFDYLRDTKSSFLIIGLLNLNCLFQNAIHYYFIYIYFNDASQSFAIASLITLIITKLVWYIGMAVPFYDNHTESESKCLHLAVCCGVIIFGDFGPFVIIIMLMNATSVSWKWLCVFIVHILLISFPMTIIHFVYIIIYDKLMIISILSIIFNLLASALLAVYFTRTVSWRISMYNVLSMLVDFINVTIKIYFLTNFIYHALYNNQDMIDKSFWNNKIMYYCSCIYFIKTFIIGPLYAIWIFVFMFFESTPFQWPLLTDLMSNHCIARTSKLFFCVQLVQCLCVSILYIIMCLFLILTIWILTECIFYCYPFLIFLYFNESHWKKCKQQNQWNYVMKYMNNSINTNDWRVRLYLLNYLFWSTNPSSAANVKFKDKGLLHKIQTAINWYVNRDKKHNTDFKQMFDIKIFRHKFYDSNGIVETIAIEYAYLLVDAFDGMDSLFDVRNGALIHFCNSTHPNTSFEWWFSGKEFAGLFIVIPLQLIASVYAAFVYPLIVYIMYLVRNVSSQRFMLKQNSEIFWMISIYWLFLISMLYFMISFVKFFYVWWHCLYRDHIGTIPCMQLSGFYEYIHSHKARINIIKTFFGPLSHEILGYLGLVVKDVYNEDVSVKIDNDTTVEHALIEKEKEEVGMLPIPKDVKQVLTDNKYISNTWDYTDFVGYKKTAKRVQNNENMVDNWHHYLFQ